MSSYPLRIDTHPGPKPAPAPRTGIPSTPLSALYTPFHTNRRPDPDTPSEVHAESEKSAAEALESVLKRLSPTRKTLDIDAASRSARTPSPTEDRKIVAEQYEIEKTIGEGAYGKVKLAIHLPTGQKSLNKVALKFLNRHLIHTTRGTSERILREILVLASLRHPNIVALLDVINSPENIILVLEYVGGGEVFDRVNRRSEQNEGKGIGEDEARRVLLQILGAVEYAHACGVVHRDLKLENLLLDDQDNVKIIDYGFATVRAALIRVVLHVFLHPKSLKSRSSNRTTF
ncbi:Protein kinase [Rhizophlyctis rosea]|uniref:Protein kinase n=1 Tax=Rhizophlyctis rosea TaxID=64517 RepID=A0AAD5SBR6_9FUNG|nr:Protein kinase [Rhizophlyctis rosea]